MVRRSHRFRSIKFLCLPPKPEYNTLLCCHYSAFTSNQTIPSEKRTFSHIFQECSMQKILKPGRSAHAHMLISGFRPTIFVTNCLIQMYVKSGAMDCAFKVFDRMPRKDTVSWNTMTFGYASVGKMATAQSLFDLMPESDVVSWNSLISGYLQNGEYGNSLDTFIQMRKKGIYFDRTTLAVVLKACSILEEPNLGAQIHGTTIQTGYDDDVVAGSALVDMYAKCKKLDDSLQMFFEIPGKNWVSWSALIAGCVQNNEFFKGLNLFKEMQKEGIGVSQSTYASVFRGCAGLSALRLGIQLHGHALKADFGSDVIVGTATMDMYAKCDRMVEARKLFNSMPNYSLQSYNAIIVGHARNDQGFEALELFHLLQKSGHHFNEISLSGAFGACAAIRRQLEGLQLHGLAVKTNLRSNICVANAILDMYGKCGAPAEAYCMFDEMERRDAVSWNAIITAFEQNENKEKTLSHFVLMLRSRMEPDEFTYGSVLKACAGQKALQAGMEVHNRIIKSGIGLDTFVGSALVDMYCKCAMVGEAEKIHYRLEEQTMVSWNAIIAGLSSQNQSEDAQRFFSHMLGMGVKPDNFTYATVLDTCANLATIGLGKQIHGNIIKLELQSDVYLTSTLVDMYSKCGNLRDSLLIFEKASKRDFVTWNAMICGCACHGLGEEALAIFESMLHENVKPNHSTFVSVLRACAHIGNVEKGMNYFQTMFSVYGLYPELEHYSCIVDIVGRSGRVGESLKLIEQMPFEADAVIWRTLLSICKIHGNVEVAEKAARSILELEPDDSSAYILLSNIYARAGMWEKVSEIRQTMRCYKLKKEPGCSWIEVKDELHLFLIFDKAHPRCKEIYDALDSLIRDMKWAGYELGIEINMFDEEVEELEQQEEVRECTYGV